MGGSSSDGVMKVVNDKGCNVIRDAQTFNFILKSFSPLFFIGFHSCLVPLVLPFLLFCRCCQLNKAFAITHSLSFSFSLCFYPIKSHDILLKTT